MVQNKNLFLKKRKKNLYSLIVIFSGVLIYAVYIEIFLSSFSLEEKEEYLFLTQLNILFISIVTLFVILYTIKIIYERKSKLAGSKMKSRLLLAFLTLFIAPLLLFFYITNDYLSNKVGQWLAPDTDVTIDKAISILQDLKSQQRQAMLDIAPYLANELALTVDFESLESNFNELNIVEPINGIVLYHQTGELVVNKLLSPLSTGKWQPLPKENFKNFIDNNQHSLDFTDEKGIRHLVVRFSNLDSQSYFLEVYLDEKNLNTTATGKTLDDLALLRSALGAGQTLAFNHKVLLASISVIMIFIFTWFAVYLSRSILRPLERLLYGMHQVTGGNLKVRLPTKVAPADELKDALSTFNEMVEQINKKSHEVADKQNQVYLINHSLNQKNQILENIFKSIHIGSATITTGGYLLEANQAFLSLFKLNHTDFKEASILYSKILPVQIVNVVDTLNDKLADEKLTFYQLNITISEPSRESYYKFEIYRIYDDKKREFCRLLLVHDLTELDKLIRARAWQDVARRIAHEIKNPLTPIRVSAERIKRLFTKDSKNPDKNLISMADSIISEVDEIKRMINEFSNFARMPITKLKPVLINSLISDFAKQFFYNLPDNIKFSLDIPKQEFKVMLDEVKFKQALYNLVKNALYALDSKKSGKIDLKLAKDESNQLLLISLADNGPGIPPSMHNTLFDPYISTNPQGSGLGLAIVKKIVNDHNGVITFKSQLSKRTVFTISLPIISN